MSPPLLEQRSGEASPTDHFAQGFPVSANAVPRATISKLPIDIVWFGGYTSCKSAWGRMNTPFDEEIILEHIYATDFEMYCRVFDGQHRDKEEGRGTGDQTLDNGNQSAYVDGTNERFRRTKAEDARNVLFADKDVGSQEPKTIDINDPETLTPTKMLLGSGHPQDLNFSTLSELPNSEADTSYYSEESQRHVGIAKDDILEAATNLQAHLPRTKLRMSANHPQMPFDYPSNWPQALQLRKDRHRDIERTLRIVSRNEARARIIEDKASNESLDMKL